MKSLVSKLTWYFSTWPKIQDKNLNTSRAKGALTLSWRRPISYRNQSIGFYMISASVMKGLKITANLKRNCRNKQQAFTCKQHLCYIFIINNRKVFKETKTLHDKARYLRWKNFETRRAIAKLRLLSHHTLAIVTGKR